MCIWPTISSCCGLIPLALGLKGRDGGLSTMCLSCRCACQQRVLSPIQAWGGWTAAFTGKVIYIYIYIYNSQSQNVCIAIYFCI